MSISQHLAKDGNKYDVLFSLTHWDRSRLKITLEGGDWWRHETGI